MACFPACHFAGSDDARARRAAWTAAVLLAAPAVAGIHGASLTTNQMPSATVVQDVRPRFDQRGTEIDGTVRSGSGMGLQLGSNPFGEGWNRHAALGSIRLATGTYAPFEVDLSFPAEIPWIIGRTYNARQDDGGHHDSNGYQGRNWFQTSQPELVYFDDTEESDDDIIYLVYGADRFAEYEKEEGGGGDEFVGVNGASGVIEFVAGTGGEPDTYVLHDPSGVVVTFFAEDYLDTAPEPDVAYSVAGQVWKIENQGGDVAYVGHATTASTAVTSGYAADGRITTAYDSAGRRFTYSYTTLDSVSRLTMVKAEVDTGSWVEVGRVEYGYSTTGGGETYCNAGCLMLATRMLPLSSTATPGTESQSEVRKTYYRYWVGAYNGSTNRGHPYGLQYVVDPEGTRAFDWAGDSTFDGDFLAASESVLKPYAAAYFEYDASRRIDKTWFNGQCGCSGGADGQHTLSYTDAGSYGAEIGNTTYSASWVQRTVVDRPDTGWVSQYFDETGQALGRVLTDGDPSGSPGGTWVHGASRNSAGQVEVVYSPASSTGYTHSTGATTYSTSVGLVTYSTYDGGGAWVTDVDWSVGYKSTVSDRSRVEERDYGTVSQVIGDQGVTRPYLRYRYAYPGVVAADASDINDPSVTGQTSESGGSIALIPMVVEAELPVVTTGENGSNAAEGRFRYRRPDGLVAYARNTQDRYDYWFFDDGVLVRRVQDADAETTGDFDSDSEPGDFGITLPSDGMHLVTSYTYDMQGRLETTTLPGGRVTRVYRTRLADARLVTLSVPRWVAGSPDTFYGPASYTVTNLAGQVVASGVLSFSGGTTTTDIGSWLDIAQSEPVKAVADGGVATLSRYATSMHDAGGTRLEESRAYFLVPDGGSSPAWVGSAGTNFDAATYAYDDMGRRIRTVDATGTITRSTYDVRGNAASSSIGTDDTGLPGSGMAGSSNMVTTETRVYDGGSSGGNNLLTSVTRYVEGSSTGQRVAEYVHDARGRVIVVKNPQSPHSVTAYDERGRVTATATYSSTSGLTASSVPTTTTNRLSYAATSYDLLNRPYDQRTYRVNQSSGAIEQESSADVCLRTRTWYDAEGRVIKTVGAAVQKTEYDTIGRAVRRFTIADTDDSVYADAATVSGDTVAEEVRTVYDNASGLVLATGVIQRNFDQTGTGALDSNADGLAMKWTAADITGRVQITAMWHDALDRPATTAVYGTNHATGNAADFDRGGLSAPGRSDTVLVTTRLYNPDGTLRSVTDPKAIETRYLYDDAHRQAAVISNYVNGVPSGPTGADDNVVRYTYANGLRTQMWVDVDGDGVQDAGVDQVTSYIYGVTKGSGAGDSRIAANNLLHATFYPDSASGTDAVFIAYNAQGQRIWQRDQIGDELEYLYDTAGRVTSVAATLETSPPSPTDDAILRIETAYTPRGQVDAVTSYDAASAGAVQNQVRYTYDAWGNITLIEQDRDSAVGGGGAAAYEAAFTYDEAGDGGATSAFLRIVRTQVAYPAGDIMSFRFGNVLGSRGDPEYTAHSLGRVDQVSLTPPVGSPVVEATYEYLGLGHVTRTHLPVPAMWSQVSSTSSAYPGLDRFNRIVSSSWTWDYATGPDHNAYEVSLTYDRNSNILWAEDGWHQGRDVLYSMDELNRLVDADRGDRSGGSITLRNFRQEWTLDQPGNWALFKNDLNGDGDWSDANEVEDARTHNEVNELIERNTNNAGGVEHTLLYTAAGQLADDDQHFKYIYDAWGRLVRITNQSDVVVTEYEYNGLGHRIGARWDVDADEDLDWEWLVYDDRWRVIARFADGSGPTEPKEQIYHHHAGVAGYGGSSYIDLVIARDQFDHGEDPPTATRDYVLQNWRADVVALAAPNGNLLERISYDAYGIPFATHPTDLTLGATPAQVGYGMPNGVVDSDDYAYFLTLYGNSDWRADWNRDGTLSAADNTAFLADYSAATGSWGRGVLSNRSNILGYAGYVHEPATGAAGAGHGTMYHCRLRVHHAGLGRWLQRDPPQFQYGEGPNLYWYGANSPVVHVDSHGAAAAETPPPRWSTPRSPRFWDPEEDKEEPRMQWPYFPRIDVRCNRLFWFAPQRHCYVVLVDPFGPDLACRGGPSTLMPGSSPSSTPGEYELPPCTDKGLGNPLRTYCGRWDSTFPDYTNTEDPYRDIESIPDYNKSIWACVRAQMEYYDCSTEYNLLGPNSNSAIASALRCCGVQVNIDDWIAPGWNNTSLGCLAEY